MPRRHRGARLGARFNTVPGGRRGRRALAKAWRRTILRVPSIGRSPGLIRGVLGAAGVQFRKR